MWGKEIRWQPEKEVPGRGHFQHARYVWCWRGGESRCQWLACWREGRICWCISRSGRQRSFSRSVCIHAPLKVVPSERCFISLWQFVSFFVWQVLILFLNVKWKNTLTPRTHACGVYLLSDLVHVLRQDLVHPPHVSNQELLRARRLLPVVTEKTQQIWLQRLLFLKVFLFKLGGITEVWKVIQETKLMFWFPSFGLSCFMTSKQGSALNRGQIHGNQIQPIRAELCGLSLCAIMKHTAEKLWMVRRSGLPRACPAAPWHSAAPTSCTEPRCWTQPCCLGPETASRSHRWTS